MVVILAKLHPTDIDNCRTICSSWRELTQKTFKIKRSIELMKYQIWWKEDDPDRFINRSQDDIAVDSMMINSRWTSFTAPVLKKFDYPEDRIPSKKDLARMFYAVVFRRLYIVIRQAVILFVQCIFENSLTIDTSSFMYHTLCQRWSSEILKKCRDRHLEEAEFIEDCNLLPVDCLWFILHEISYAGVNVPRGQKWFIDWTQCD